MRLTAAAAAAFALALPLSLCAVDAGARSEDTDSDPIWLQPLEPCRPGSPKHREASAGLESLRSQLDQRQASPTRSPSSPPSPQGRAEVLELAELNQSLRALLTNHCFAFAEHENPRGVTAPSVAAFRAWWLAGGHGWLRSYLHLGDPSSPEGQKIVLPPAMPQLPRLGSAEKEIPIEMLCAPASDCGPIVAGWEARAEAALRYHAVDNGRAAPSHAIGRSGAPEPKEPKAPKEPKDPCLAELARAARPSERYMGWRRCVDQQDEPEYGLPFGSFRPLVRGWLIVRGRRGHYQFCDEVRAYDLATGAAFVAKDCSGLALRGNGSVDAAAIAQGRVQSTEIGRLPLDALREAAWMLALAPQVEARHRHSRAVPLPKGLRPIWRVLHSTTGRGGSAWGSSAQTLLGWAIVDAGDRGRTVARGRLTWPGSSEPGEHHAAQLLDIAERSLVPGCPPAGLPASLPLDLGQPAVSPLPATPTQITGAQSELATRLRQAAAVPSAQPCFPSAP